MKCPKCDHDNDEFTIFCEGCDHRLSIPVKDGATIPALYAVPASLALGAASLIFALWMKDLGRILPVCAGAVGLILGTYSMSVVRNTVTKNKMMMLILTGIAAMISAMGFMFGLMNK